jgi:DNA-binding response OmpR family regulator
MAYVLIVDDDEDFASATAAALTAAGYEVRTEYAIPAALQSMAARRPDLVVLDVMFPEDNTAGFELARAMRLKHPDLRQVPILMLTAVNTRFPFGFSAKDIDEDWLPVNDFLEKPVDLDVLTARVAAMLAGRGGH